MSDSERCGESAERHVRWRVGFEHLGNNLLGELLCRF